MDSPTDSSSPSSAPCKWYVLTHLDMSRFKRWLDIENARRLGEGKYLLEPFYPYHFLSQRKAHTIATKVMVGGRERTVMTEAVTHEDFRNLVFLRGTEQDVDDIVTGGWNQSFMVRLHYYKDADGNHATVPDKEMKEFFENCVRYRGFFEVCPSVRELVSLDRVEILTGPFAGHEADVVRATHSMGGVHLELNVPIASGILTVKMKDVRSSQVVRLDTAFSGKIHDDFIERSQNKILSVFEHRVKRINDVETRQSDVRKLNEVFRYNQYSVENRAAHAHFRALMLICAHLRHDRQAEETIRGEVESLLEDINRNSPSKADTDTRTYLWIALYISTGVPTYREAAKDYVKVRAPKSRKLRKFVSLMRQGKRV